MTPRPALLPRLALWLGLAALVACEGRDPGAEPADPGPRLLRLWERSAITPVEVSRPAPAGDEPQVWFASRFDGSQTWYRARALDGGGMAFADVRPEGGQVVLGPEQRFGLCAAGPMVGGRALSLRLTVRPERLDPEADPLCMLLAVVVEREQPFDAAEVLDGQQVADLLDERKSPVRLLTAEVADQRLVLRDEFVTEPTTRSLQVFLIAPKPEERCQLVFESLVVGHRTLAEHEVGGGEITGVTRRDDGAAIVRLDRDERVALPATPPSRYVFDLPPSAEPRTLELSLGVTPRPGDAGQVRLLVRAADRLLLDVTRRPPSDLADPAWSDQVLELPALPDRPLRLELVTEAVGDDPPLAWLGHPTVSRPGPRERPNVLLISLDTLRPDRLGSYGAEPSWSPHLDALAAEGLRWTDAYSTSSYTLPSHASMLTGQWPAFHGAVDVVDRIDPGHSPLLALQLADAGYATAGFTGGGYVSADYGFGVGFDRYSHNDPVWALETVRGRQLMDTMSWERQPIRPELLERYDVRAIERWIDERPADAPFFLFVHTYIVHNYAPDQGWLERMELLGKPGDPDWQQPFNHQDRARFNEGAEIPVDQVVEQYLPYYDGTIGMADAFVGRLLAALEAAGLADDTLVVVTSDHGEEFGEHGFFGHGETLYDSNTRVPLIARLPADRRGAGPAVIRDPASLVDIAPWILSVVGLEPDPRMDTESVLAPEQRDPPARSGADDVVIMELDNHRYRTSALRQGDLKLIARLGRDAQEFDQPEFELHDLASDPGEQDDLAASRADRRARLWTLLERFHEMAGAIRPRDGGPIDVSTVSPEMRQQLQALGYLGDLPQAGGAGASSEGGDGDGDDGC